MSTFASFRSLVPDDGGYMSPLIPTRKFGVPALGCFWASRSLATGQVSQAASWFAVDPTTENPIGFWSGSFSDTIRPTPTFVVEHIGSALEVKDARKSLALQVKAAAVLFFENKMPPVGLRDSFKAAYCADEYRALVSAFPDFFAWLAA